jgi:hypothetical protein
MSITPISVSAWATADLMLSWSVTSSSTTCAQRLQPLHAARGEHDARAAAGERAREVRAQAARCARDERHPARQVDLHSHGGLS